MTENEHTPYSILYCAHEVRSNYIVFTCLIGLVKFAIVDVTSIIFDAVKWLFQFILKLEIRNGLIAFTNLIGWWNVILLMVFVLFLLYQTWFMFWVLCLLTFLSGCFSIVGNMMKNIDLIKKQQ